MLEAYAKDIREAWLKAADNLYKYYLIHESLKNEKCNRCP